MDENISVDSIAANTRILVADDEYIMREVLISILEEGGFKNVFEAENGSKALSELKVGNYDLLITDTNMPGLKGYEVIKQHKESGQANGTKYIAIGGSIDKPVIDLYASMGVSFLAKPFFSKDIYMAMKQVLGHD